MLKLKPTIKYLLILLGFSLAALGGCAAEEEPEPLDWQASGIDLKDSVIPEEVDDIATLDEYLRQMKNELQLLYLPSEVEKGFLEMIFLQVKEKESAEDGSQPLLLLPTKRACPVSILRRARLNRKSGTCLPRNP